MDTKKPDPKKQHEKTAAPAGKPAPKGAPAQPNKPRAVPPKGPAPKR